MAWPITPYVDGDLLAVTSTAAYLAKAERIRRDPGIAILAGGILNRGFAKVLADPTGERFAARLLAQEREKFPPLGQIESVPGHRKIFAWYFARAHILLRPDDPARRPGADALVMVTLGPDGLPEMWRLPALEPAALEHDRIDLGDAVPADRTGSALLLAHAEDEEMRDLRAVHLRGRLHRRLFVVGRRSGSLEVGRTGAWRQAREQVDLYRRGRAGRRRLRRWQEADGARDVHLG
jgi:hypothetical protein